jgi:luciferase family oxidoreductase group 1
MHTPLSILDLAFVARGETAAEALGGSLALAQLAEARGYRRVWYAEHHNMRSIASSAPAVLIAHVAAHTRSIRLGAGGVMLPNHSPLSIAEQFGTLACLHPGRIELGLGRAPGGDAAVFRALRRDPAASEAFPDDVRELQAYLAGEAPVGGVTATPGAGTRVPLYILGSSLFGASLAAAFGLPYAFASHFAPAALQQAVALYRSRFQPSAALDRPYVIAGVNVLAADSEAEARAGLQVVQRQRAELLLARGRRLSDAEADALLASPQGQFLREMMHYAVVGERDAVRDGLERFRAHADADELILAHAGPTQAARLGSVARVADAYGL